MQPVSIASISVLSPISEAGEWVVAADGWSYGLPESSGLPARSVSAHSWTNPGCSSVQGAARSLRCRDPLRLRAKLNKMNIQPRLIMPKPPKAKNLYLTFSLSGSAVQQVIPSDAN